MKKLVMKTAWAVAAHFANFSEALRYAWKVCKLRTALMLGVVRFQYTKVSGEVRTAFGTLSATPQTKGKSAPNGVFTYYDVQAQGWRSAKIENLIFEKGGNYAA